MTEWKTLSQKTFISQTVAAMEFGLKGLKMPNIEKFQLTEDQLQIVNSVYERAREIGGQGKKVVTRV